MFEIFFGWKKASKCKKLIKRVQCRIKLLKNKRCSIVRHLRDDVAQLLRYGHDQSAFDRVEQLYKDESIVTVYELLDIFCEFILHNLSYIRRHKDCPNDINEAVSSLIFASARCGDIPELPLIRKLFGERYGQGFAVVAMELLPGNLVNPQIRDNLSIKSVSNEVKYKLVDEIARSILPLSPLPLEYHHKDRKYGLVDKFQVPSNKPEADGKKLLVDNKSCASLHAYPNYTVDYLTRKTTDITDEDSSSESSYNMPEETIYLDDIAEFQSPRKDGKDQRLFVFKSMFFPTQEKIYAESLNPNCRSRRYRKRGENNGKRSREREFSWETNNSVRDVEYVVPKGKTRPNDQQKHHEKMETEESQKKYIDDSFNGRIINKKQCEYTKYESDSIRWENIMEKKESKQPYLRAKDTENDNILRANSFPINCSSPHVHPKLPDYDELAAKFTALKNANLQKKMI